ncbi:nucleotide-binding protein [Desulfolucanica intricata]|uniref:ATP-binding protein n=1 Tax=Desulfolucanica intricata TaxID=1285191 RepID=UPI00082EED4B|nr:AAA family ATPase [Desulfolucanica intricata]
MKLAISGKGGVGKTTVSSALVSLFSKTHQTVYAIDADPDACLAAAVGIPDAAIKNLKPMVEMKDVISAKTGEGVFYNLNPKVDDVIDEYSIKLNNIRFLRMGGIKKGGSSCYCRENTFLYAIVNSLLLDQDDVVIMDMGAGIEHLSRGTAKGVDIMLVVIEPSKNSVNTARLVQKLAGDLGIKKVMFIGNKIRNQRDKDFISSKFSDNEILGFINFDESVWNNSMLEETATISSQSLLFDMQKIYNKIIEEVNAE